MCFSNHIGCYDFKFVFRQQPEQSGMGWSHSSLVRYVWKKHIKEPVHVTNIWDFLSAWPVLLDFENSTLLY